MEKNLVDDQSRDQEMDSSKSLSKVRGAYTDDGFHLCMLKSKTLVRLGNPDCTLAAKVMHSKICKQCTEDSFCGNASSLDDHISKNIVSIDERYLRRFLELIYVSAANAFIYNIPSKMGILSGNLRSAKIISEDTFDLPASGLDCPMLAGSGSVLTSPSRHSIVGSVMRSKSMVNLLKSPLLQKYGVFGNNANLWRNSDDVESSICYDLVSSPNTSSSCPSRKLEYGTSTERTQKCRRKRIASTSSTNSSSSDRTSSSVSCAVSQGMLQCTWRGEDLLFIFSVDDQKEIYTARSSKVETAKDNDLDWVYLIYSKSDGITEHESYDKESHLVGKVKVSSSFTLCSCNLETRETEYVLFGGIDNLAGETQNPTRHRRKYSGIPKKVVEALRITPSKQRRVSRKNVLLEDSSLEQCQDSCNKPESQCVSSLLDNNLPANYELAAIVMKDHLPEKPREEIGGWGLNFLKKADMKQDIDLPKPSVPSQCGARSAGDCSTSMDILIPAGIHDGPRTRNGGPSSLTERWKSGGHCDCGGWDLGCPLMVLKTKSGKEEVLPQANSHGEYKSFDIFVQGSNHCSPTLRMASVRDGLYLIHFQSTLSALQCLSIAVAYCHSRSLSSQSKHGHEMA